MHYKFKLVVLSSLLSLSLFYCNRLGQVSGEIDVESFTHSEPVGNKLERNDIQQALKTVYRLWDFYLLRLLRRKLAIVGITDDNWPSTTGDDCIN